MELKGVKQRCFSLKMTTFALVMKIFGIGMNYLLHTQELQGGVAPSPLASLAEDRRPKEPIVFLKPDSALLKNGKPFFVPDWAERFDYEAELVVRICRLGKGIPLRFAHRYWDALTVGIDFTARDVQQEARRQGLPWTVCKGFDGSATLGEWVEMTPPADVDFRLDLNQQTVQRGSSTDMLFSIDELISYLSRFFTLRTGDLLFTGTPVGVGPVKPGDHLEGYLADQKVLDFFCR